MISKNIALAIVVALTLLVFTSCGKDSKNAVSITVLADTDGEFALSIANPTTHTVLFDDPRFSSSTRFEWELFSGREVVARNGKEQIARDYLLPGHLSTGPVDIWPGRPIKCGLTKYYPELGKSNLLGKADSLLWYCRVWDETATNWIQASGKLRL